MKYLINNLEFENCKENEEDEDKEGDLEEDEAEEVNEFDDEVLNDKNKNEALNSIFHKDRKKFIQETFEYFILKVSEFF